MHGTVYRRSLYTVLLLYAMVVHDHSIHALWHSYYVVVRDRVVAVQPQLHRDILHVCTYTYRHAVCLCVAVMHHHRIDTRVRVPIQ